MRSSFPAASIPYSSPATVIFRDKKLELDNGNCRGAPSVQFFTGLAPTTTANCKPNEVEVPDVRGATLEAAKAHLLGQPLLTQIKYRPAKAGQRLGIVIGQTPRSGTLSAYDKVTLVLPRAVHGIVPKLVGVPIARARAELRRLKVRVRITGSEERAGRRPGAALGRGVRARDARRPHRPADANGRLRKREPARP